MNARGPLLLSFATLLLSGVRAATLEGTWFREVEEAKRIVCTEVTFAADGTYIRTIFYTPRPAPDKGTIVGVLGENGKWKQVDAAIVITVPGLAAPRKGPAAARTFRWHIEELTEKKLSMWDEEDFVSIAFRKR